jgi:hypothetical protein
MENIELGGMLKDSFGSLQRYIELQLKYNKLLLTQKLSEILSLIVLFVILLGLSGFILIFLSLAFVNWYGEHFGSLFHGYLWVTLFYALLAILIYLLRKPLLFGPLRIVFGNILFREEALNKEDVPFTTKEELSINIAKCKAELHVETEELKAKVESLGENLTITNIILNVGKSLYNSYVTTSNIVKVSAFLMSKLLSKKKKKRKKDQEEEESD